MKNKNNFFWVRWTSSLYGNNESFGSPEKSLVLTLVNQRKKIVLVYIIMAIIVICLLMEKKSITLKPITGMSTLQLSFV